MFVLLCFCFGSVLFCLLTCRQCLPCILLRMALIMSSNLHTKQQRTTPVSMVWIFVSTAWAGMGQLQFFVLASLIHSVDNAHERGPIWRHCHVCSRVQDELVQVRWHATLVAFEHDDCLWGRSRALWVTGLRCSSASCACMCKGQALRVNKNGAPRLLMREGLRWFCLQLHSCRVCAN